MHRDIKPKNILVSNLHYCDQDKEHAGRTFQSCPIVCKLADLGESRATFARTYADKMTHTRFLKRGTLPFMAPEILVEKYMLNGASLDDLKKVDVWALIMTLFVVINPDQRYPFEENLERQRKEDSNKNYVYPSEELILKKMLEEKVMPTMSMKYAQEQATDHAHLRQVVSSGIAYNPRKRPTVDQIWQKLCTKDQVEFHQLDVSQATAIEQCDHTFAQELAKGGIPNKPNCFNDGTNACAFLSLKICDRLVTMKPNMLEVQKLVDLANDVIIRFPEYINTFRNISDMPDARIAHNVLLNHKMLDNSFVEIIDKLSLNETLYSVECQTILIKTLEDLVESAKFDGLVKVNLIHVALYVFSIVVFPDKNIAVVETHPINPDVGGNNNGLVVTSTSPLSIWKWIVNRMKNSKVNPLETPTFTCFGYQ